LPVQFLPQSLVADLEQPGRRRAVAAHALEPLAQRRLLGGAGRSATHFTETDLVDRRRLLLAVAAASRAQPRLQLFLHVRVITEDDPALHEALQLADVARPVVGEEQFQDFARELRLRSVELAGVPDPEVVSNERYLLALLAQWWYHDGDDAKHRHPIA